MVVCPRCGCQIEEMICPECNGDGCDVCEDHGYVWSVEATMIGGDDE
jgi:hypothetical protein